MKGRKELQKFTLCPHAYAGTIMGQKVVMHALRPCHAADHLVHYCRTAHPALLQPPVKSCWPPQYDPEPLHLEARCVHSHAGPPGTPTTLRSLPDRRAGACLPPPPLQTMVITTGIGPMASVTCIQDILTQCGPLIKDIVYSGECARPPAGRQE
jgi:hypothetical protein